MKKAVQQKLMSAGRITAYATFAIIVFVIGFRVSFPVTVLTDLITSQAAKKGVYLNVGDASMSGLIGMELTDVKVGPKNERFRAHLDSVRAGVGLFSLIAGKPHVSLTVESGAGHIGPVDVVVKKKTVDVKIKEIKDFSITGLPVKIGKLTTVLTSGDGEFHYDLKRGLYNSRGYFQLETTHTGLIKPVVKLPGFGDFKLTSIDLGKVKLRIDVGRRTELRALRKYRGMRSKDRVINLSKLIISGRDLKLIASPSSTLKIPTRGSLGFGMLNLEVAFHIMNAFFDKKTKIDNQLQQPNKGIRTLLAMDPKWKRAFYKGFYGLLCTGPLKHPRCFPKRTNQKISYFHLNKKETIPPKGFGGFGLPKPKNKPAAPVIHPAIKRRSSFGRNRHRAPGFVPSNHAPGWHGAPEDDAVPANLPRPTKAVERAAIHSKLMKIPKIPMRTRIHMDRVAPILHKIKIPPPQEEPGPGD